MYFLKWHMRLPYQPFPGPWMTSHDIVRDSGLWFSHKAGLVALFPGCSHLQCLIACSIYANTEGEDLGEIWSCVMTSGRQMPNRNSSRLVSNCPWHHERWKVPWREWQPCLLSTTLKISIMGRPLITPFQPLCKNVWGHFDIYSTVYTNHRH